MYVLVRLSYVLGIFVEHVRWYGMVWYGNILFDIVHNVIENILPKHKNM